MLEIYLIDLLDARYSNEIGIAILPYLNFKWMTVEDGMPVFILQMGWFNYELNFTLFDVDVYYEAMEKLLEDMKDSDNNRQDDDTES